MKELCWIKTRKKKEAEAKRKSNKKMIKITKTF